MFGKDFGRCGIEENMRNAATDKAFPNLVSGLDKEIGMNPGIMRIYSSECSFIIKKLWAMLLTRFLKG
jgi:hypothetical protein